MATKLVRLSIGALAFGALLSSCATLVDGTHQGIRFESVPPGATVHIDGYPDITTPGSLELARDRSYSATIHKDGYHDTTVVINRQFNAATLGNVLFFPVGIVGLAIDANHGSMGHLSPETVNVALQDAAAPATAAESNTVPAESALPPAAAFLPSAAVGPELRQSAAAAAAVFTGLDPYERVELPISVYELHLEQTEAQIAGLSFGDDDASMEVHKAITTILAYHQTARDIRRAKMESLDKLKRDVRAGLPIPFLPDSEVPRWVVRYPFLNESLEEPPGPGLLGEAAGSWYPDRATELLWEHARADTRELAAWAAAPVR